MRHRRHADPQPSVSAACVVNYATYSFSSARRRNTRTALSVGKASDVLEFGPRDLATDFRTKNQAILSQHRGAGYWLWKPYIILRSMEALSPGSWIFYVDAGAFFTSEIAPLIRTAEGFGGEIFSFGPGESGLPKFAEKRWTKRDAFRALNCDSPAFAESVHRASGYILLRNGATAYRLIAEWLEKLQDPRCSTDQPSHAPNYPEFTEHRHDQSVWSLISKREKIALLRDPSQNGLPYRYDFPDQKFPQILELPLHRRNRSYRVLEFLNRALESRKG